MNSALRMIESEVAMEALGAALAARLGAARLVYIRGPLGAGKTTLVRGLLRGLGHVGAVKSPTFTLVEPYVVERFTLYHFDLYRLKDAEELEFMGWRDYLSGSGVCVVEWPERADRLLPAPDVDVMINPTDDRTRHVTVSAHTESGRALVEGLAS